MATTPHTVGLLLPQGFIRHAAVRLIGELPGYTVVAQAADAPAFKRAFAVGAPPQLAVVGLEVALQAVGEFMAWLVRHLEPAPAALARLLCAGAHGFVCTRQGPEQLGVALAHLVQDVLHFSPAVHAQLRTVPWPDPARPLAGAAQLSPRQQEFVQLVVQHPDMPFDDMAPLMQVEPCTIQKFRAAVFKKLGCTSKAGLVKVAMELRYDPQGAHGPAARSPPISSANYHVDEEDHTRDRWSGQRRLLG